MASVNSIGKSLTLRVNCGTLTGAVSERRFYRQLRAFQALAGGFYEDCKRDVELSLTFLHFDILH